MAVNKPQSLGGHYPGPLIITMEVRFSARQKSAFLTSKAKGFWDEFKPQNLAGQGCFTDKPTQLLPGPDDSADEGVAGLGHRLSGP
jgi:hypothetical protein